MKKVSNINIVREFPLPTPREILAELPLTTEITEHIYAARTTTENILARRDKRILMICGPCSIDSIPAAMEYAMHLKQLQAKVQDKMFVIMRSYFEKPRTTVGWKGLIYDPDLDQSFNIEKGLRLARKLLIQLAEMEMPAAT
ncbi:MAG: 3-deoxy-7-phosphoheptulonate synthase, partial [Lentisphaeria bacterium]|nr:3-deoxy-7-phosphoheptulonate synthase [Lentisphaeria bacterium]